MPRPGDLGRTLLTMGSKRHPTDLSDAVWKCLKVHFPSPSKRGRPRTHGSRAILDAIFYVLKSGCPEAAAEGFPPWKSVYDWFGRWCIDGTWKRLNAALCEIVGPQALGSRHIRQMGGPPPGSWIFSTTSNPLRA